MRNALRGNRASLSRRGGEVAVASCESHASKQGEGRVRLIIAKNVMFVLKFFC